VRLDAGDLLAAVAALAIAWTVVYRRGR